MNTGTITTCTEQDSRFGGKEKVCDIAMDGQEGTVRVYAKSHTKANKPISYYPNVHQGARVELTPKSNGTGYFIQKVIGEATVPAPNMQPAPPNPPRQAPASNTGPDAKTIATYIENKAGQVAHAYQSLKKHFASIGEDFTPEIFNSCISTVIISTDKHFNNGAAAWGDSRPILVSGSPEWDKVIAAIEKHGKGTVDKVLEKARVTPPDERYLRQVEVQVAAYA